MAGDEIATIWAGDTAYGAKSSVAWRDAGGSEHDSGWPACLSVPGAVTAVSFAGAVVWHEDFGIGTILWVDCRGR